MKIIDRPRYEKEGFTRSSGAQFFINSKAFKNHNVSMDVLPKVCAALDVDFGDIMTLMPDKTKEK